MDRRNTGKPPMVTEPSRRFFLTGRSTPPAAGIEIGAACFAARGIVCQSCGDLCPETAIRFHPRHGAPPVPSVNATTCNGCGECITGCPASAIQMAPVHV